MRVPAPAPDFALQAAAVYRLEIGAACFAVFYLAAMAFVLALDGRGFAELGTKGLRVEQVVELDEKRQKATRWQREIDHEMQMKLKRIPALQRDVKRKLQLHEQRLEKLERNE